MCLFKTTEYLTSNCVVHGNLLPMALVLVSKDAMNRHGLFNFCAAKLQAAATCAVRDILKPYAPPNRRTWTSMLGESNVILVMTFIFTSIISFWSIP